MKDFTYLRHWLTGEGYGQGFEPRPVILECIPSRSGMSLQVYDRGERLFSINGCGFDRLGSALAEFLERLFQAELEALALSRLDINTRPEKPFGWMDIPGFYGTRFNFHGQKLGFGNGLVALEGSAGFEPMAQIAESIGLRVHRSESKSGTLIIIEKARKA